MRTLLTFSAGFYLGGVAIMTAIGVAFEAPLGYAAIVGLGWPFLVAQIILAPGSPLS